MAGLILVLDDSLEARILLRKSFKKINVPYEIVEAANPVEALEIFHEKKEQIIYIVSDYYLPQDNGLEFCRLVKDNEKDIKIILYTVSQDFKNPDNYPVDLIIQKGKNAADEVAEAILNNSF